MNVKGYKTQKTHRNKQTFIKGKMGVPPWNGVGGLNRQEKANAGNVTQKIHWFISVQPHPHPICPLQMNSVNKSYPRPINLPHQQRQNSM